MIRESVDKAIEVAKAILPSRPQKEEIQKVAQAILNLAHAKSVLSDIESWDDQNDELNKEIELVLGLVRPSLTGTELVQTTQAALNLINAKATLIERKSTKKKQGAGT